MIRVVHGEEIRHWYNERNHSELVRFGRLFFSSMKHEHMQPFFNLYTNNANVGLLIATNIDSDNVERLLGRALVWNTEEGETVVDQLYAEEIAYKDMLKHVFDNDFAWAPFTPRRFKVRMEHMNCPPFPYVDTFSYVSFDKDGWYLTNHPDMGTAYELSSHKGEIYRYEPKEWEG